MQNKKTTPIIGIDAADLCYKRIDGTRIYIHNLLQRFGAIAPEAKFNIYLKGPLNPELRFKIYPNYNIRSGSFPFLWTQLKLPRLVMKDDSQVLWMPLHNLPAWRPKKLKTVVTIHDLAFKLFPNLFPARDLFLLNKLTNFAVKNSDRIIAVSRSTARDLTESYNLSPAKIRVIHHGYDNNLFHLPSSEEKKRIPLLKEKYKIDQSSHYLIYVGALQPRKNLGILISAFERLKTLHSFHDWKLVLAGPKAWLFEDLLKQINTSVWKKDIILTGNFSTSDLPYLLWGADMFVFPSLYEGFGIPILEAMACGIPVVCARNSSLIEVAGTHAAYFDARKIDELTASIRTLNANETKRKELIIGGLEWVKRFTWEETARKTYEYLAETALS